ncbi:hypothetical protein LOTGIDRAFT_183454 [Lottia gigantea]|uniref:Kazal-like domain-containing protein n=1 Tax=Lottia gigantea TaxID=225164 RepID=V3ZRQ9_LOTGI|nr:hypothetical protein LOTGIDRAFT_183454 [Lottia gigantea]ESO87027.1 hypothetical protein LOTGIDRAFT_183454 [Lottia gigantea]
MCHDGVCVCLPDDACLKHSHPVCGTDGLWYPSHCELHRTACIHRIHIKPETKCDYKDYQQFKEKLLLHHYVLLISKLNHWNLISDREYLATLIFSYYDRDIDYYLEKKDLEIMQKKEQLVILDTVCTLLDILVYDDSEPKDAKLSVTEFLKAFGMYDHRKANTIVVIPTLATVGNGLELKCAIPGQGNGDDVIWKRFDTEIIHSTDGLTVFDDGSLFFNQVGVHHIGNYSCSHKNTNIKQVHVLKVQMSPLVRVSPVSQLRLSNTDITVKCHTEGIPTPSVSWEINEMSLPNDPRHFQESDNNETLTIHNADYHRDTGAYKCVAKNQAGTAEDVASIFIQDDHSSSCKFSQFYSSSQKSDGTFMVFHTHGYTAYRPESCLMRREVRGKFGNFKFIPDNLDEPMSLCHNNKCNWGTSVNVKDEFVYVSQPSQNRIVVIETTDKWNPVQVIDTDREPIGLYYIPHLDQVWVLCWNGKDDGSMKTVVVIRDASQDIQHHAVHTQPVGNRFDLVKDIFIPPQNNLKHHFNFGYIVHSEQRGLFKLDLIEMKYVNVIDFSQFDCIPKSLAFVPIGGHVVVECVIPSSEKTLQIVLDYITDAIISHISLPGRPFVSPDSRHLVTVDYFSGKVAVSTISQDGVMEMGFEVIVSTVISDVEFFPSASRKGYDFIMSSADTEDIIILSLNNGKVQKIKGTHKIGGDVSLTPSHSTRTVVSGGIFGDFFMMPFDSTISIIDGKHHHVKCEFKGVLQSKGIVFVEN